MSRLFTVSDDLSFKEVGSKGPSLKSWADEPNPRGSAPPGSSFQVPSKF